MLRSKPQLPWRIDSCFSLSWKLISGFVIISNIYQKSVGQQVQLTYANPLLDFSPSRKLDLPIEIRNQLSVQAENWDLPREIRFSDFSLSWKLNSDLGTPNFRINLYILVQAESWDLPTEIGFQMLVQGWKLRSAYRNQLSDFNLSWKQNGR